MLYFILNYYFIYFSYERQILGDECKLQCESKGGRLPGHDEIKDFSKIDFNQTEASVNSNWKNIHESPDFRYFVNAEYSFNDQKWFWRQNEKVFTNEKWTEFEHRANPALRDILQYSISLPSTLFRLGWNSTGTYSSNDKWLNESTGYYSCLKYSDQILQVIHL